MCGVVAHEAQDVSYKLHPGSSRCLAHSTYTANLLISIQLLSLNQQYLRTARAPRLSRCLHARRGRARVSFNLDRFAEHTRM